MSGWDKNAVVEAIRKIIGASAPPEPPAPPASEPAPPASEPAPPASEPATPTIWENFICLNSDAEPLFKLLGAAKDYYEADARKHEWKDIDFSEALARDHFPLPATQDREGYYGSDHFSYWASGLKDALLLVEATRAHGTTLRDYLDIGCASGRVLRHFAVQWPNARVMGCDINRMHVEWCNANLPQNCMAFQNHSIPVLPLPDESFDLVSAFSVFTHIEALETAWLMEIRRILRPGGIAWITVHTEFTLREMNEDWPLWTPVMSHPASSQLLDADRNFKGDRMVLRWLAGQSYSSNVFYKLDYLKRRWGHILEIAEVRRRCPSYQDVLVLRKQAVSAKGRQ